MTDKRIEIEGIIAELEREAGAGAIGEGFDAVAKGVAQYYDALIESGVGEPLAVALVMQWHMLLWTSALASAAMSAEE